MRYFDLVRFALTIGSFTLAALDDEKNPSDVSNSVPKSNSDENLEEPIQSTTVTAQESPVTPDSISRMPDTPEHAITDKSENGKKIVIPITTYGADPSRDNDAQDGGESDEELAEYHRQLVERVVRSGGGAGSTMKKRMKVPSKPESDIPETRNTPTPSPLPITVIPRAATPLPVGVTLPLPRPKGGKGGKGRSSGADWLKEEPIDEEASAADSSDEDNTSFDIGESTDNSGNESSSTCPGSPESCGTSSVRSRVSKMRIVPPETPEKGGYYLRSSQPQKKRVPSPVSEQLDPRRRLPRGVKLVFPPPAPLGEEPLQLPWSSPVGAQQLRTLVENIFPNEDQPEQAPSVHSGEGSDDSDMEHRKRRAPTEPTDDDSSGSNQPKRLKKGGRKGKGNSKK